MTTTPTPPEPSKSAGNLLVANEADRKCAITVLSHLPYSGWSNDLRDTTETIAAHRESAVAQACAERDADNAMWKTKQECAIAQIELSNQAVASLEAKLTAKDAEIRRLKELADSAVREQLAASEARVKVDNQGIAFGNSWLIYDKMLGCGVESQEAREAFYSPASLRRN
jgi:hypothetical protein